MGLSTRIGLVALLAACKQNTPPPPIQNTQLGTETAPLAATATTGFLRHAPLAPIDFNKPVRLRVLFDARATKKDHEDVLKAITIYTKIIDSTITYTATDSTLSDTIPLNPHALPLTLYPGKDTNDFTLLVRNKPFEYTRTEQVHVKPCDNATPLEDKTSTKTQYGELLGSLVLVGLPPPTPKKPASYRQKQIAAIIMHETDHVFYGHTYALSLQSTPVGLHERTMFMPRTPAVLEALAMYKENPVTHSWPASKTEPKTCDGKLVMPDDSARVWLQNATEAAWKNDYATAQAFVTKALFDPNFRAKDPNLRNELTLYNRYIFRKEQSTGHAR